MSEQNDLAPSAAAEPDPHLAALRNFAAHQARTDCHPYTCGNRQPDTHRRREGEADHGILVPAMTPDGSLLLLCRDCDYEQAFPWGVAAPPAVEHGRTCPKVSHDGLTGTLHGPEDDGPYDDDGVSYCGRCHCAIYTATGGAASDADAMYEHWLSGHEYLALTELRRATDREAHRFLTRIAAWQRCPKPSDHDDAPPAAAAPLLDTETHETGVHTDTSYSRPYQAYCECGWCGKRRAILSSAAEDALHHRTAAPPAVKGEAEPTEDLATINLSNGIVRWRVQRGVLTGAPVIVAERTADGSMVRMFRMAAAPLQESGRDELPTPATPGDEPVSGREMRLMHRLRWIAERPCRSFAAVGPSCWSMGKRPGLGGMSGRPCDPCAARAAIQAWEESVAGREWFHCPDCGPRVAVDEYGCCVTCGADCILARQAQPEGERDVRTAFLAGVEAGRRHPDDPPRALAPYIFTNQDGLEVWSCCGAVPEEGHTMTCPWRHALAERQGVGDG